MAVETLLALIGATALLVAIPGPNLALFVGNTLAYGVRAGAVTVFGTALGVAIQLALVVFWPGGAAERRCIGADMAEMGRCRLSDLSRHCRLATGWRA